MFGTMENMHMSVQMLLQHTLRFFDGDSRSSSVSMAPGAGFCGAAALSDSVAASTAMGSDDCVGWDDISGLFTATRLLSALNGLGTYKGGEEAGSKTRPDVFVKKREC